jgi:hypothetical protein
MSMELYMTQLSEDLRIASKKAATSAERELAAMSNDDVFEQHLLDVEKYIHGEREALSAILGFEQPQFPPPERITITQQEALFADMNALLHAFNFCAEFPPDLPAHLKYAVLRENWDMECVLVASGCSHLEFCEYEPKECPFPKEHCMCGRLTRS